MAINKTARIQVSAYADNASTTFVLNLMHDPYLIGSNRSGGTGGRTLNGFADPGASGTSKPTAIKLISGAQSAVLNTTTWDVTITVLVKPVGHMYIITMDLLF